MNAICAQWRKTQAQRSGFNLSIFVQPGRFLRARRSRDDDDVIIGNYSDPIDDSAFFGDQKSTTPASVILDPDDLTEKQVLEALRNTTEMIQTYLNENYEGFRRSSEVNAMTTLAAFGLFLNLLSLVAIVLDRRTDLTARRVHGSYVVAQQVFLVFVICFLHLKKVGFFAVYKDLEAFNYFTVCFGLVQFLQPWMLFAVAGYVRGCLENLFDIGKAPKFPVAFVVTSLLIAGSLFSMYIPPARVHLYRAVTDYVLCEDPPVEKLWNLDKIGDKSLDLVTILVYNLSYIFAIYLVPSVLTARRSKGIVDLLHALQQQPKVLANCQELASTSLVISVTCNIHLACLTIKVVVYLFYLVELFFSFVEGAFVFFQYMSVFANLLIITGTGSHVFVLMRYNRTVKYFLLRVVYQMKLRFHWLNDSLPKWKLTKPTEPTEIDPNPTIELSPA